MRYKVLAKFAACALFFIFNSLAVRAQFRNAIEGTVAEQSGKVIPGAQMILVNIETGVTQTAKTNSEGSYRFPSLPPGRYKITASSTGFKSATQENITLEGSEVRTIPIMLEVGEVNEKVTVTSEPLPVQLSEGKVSENVTTYEVRNLPLAGRNILDLVSLTPGVTGVGNMSSEAGSTWRM